MTVGENIKRIRKERGLTQKKLGELCGINEVQIRQYELVKANPKVETVSKIATALDVTIPDLMPDYFEDTMQALSETTSFYNYLLGLGYEVHESPYNDKWVITIKDTEQKIYISNTEMKYLEAITKENIDLRISSYLNDGKHQQ